MSSAPPRRSARLRTAAKLNRGDDSERALLDEDNDPQSREQSPQPPPAKRARKGERGAVAKGKHPTRMKGRLSNLPQMPLDILFEIFKLLTPVDLLRLARTTKAIRSTLMNRSAVTVWKGARANVPGLPECPEDVSEPRFANFMFTTNCLECLAPRASNEFPSHFVRYCKRCVDDKVLWNAWRHDLVIATFKGKIEFRSLVYTYFVTPKSGHPRPAWLSLEFNEMREQFLQFEDSESGREQFINARKEAYLTMSKWRNTYSQWVYDKHQARADELEDARLQRLSAIQDRLERLGWGDTLENLTWVESAQFEDHPLVKQPRPLTERIWKKIAAELLALMQRFKEQRLKRERIGLIRERRATFVQAVNNYTMTHPVDAALPSPADLYHMDDVRPFKEMIEDGPNDMEFSLASLVEFTNKLPQLCDEWKAECLAMILDICNTSRPPNDSEVTEATLKLAKSTFVCTECDQPVTYPHVLHHLCFSKSYMICPLIYGTLEQLRVAEDLNGSPWLKTAPDRLKWDRPSISIAASILEDCGFDSTSTTQDDLDSEPLLLSRSTLFGDVHLMGWRRAVKFACILNIPGVWQRIEDERILNLVPRLELAHYMDSRDVICVCDHCHKWLTSSELFRHMTSHKADQPILRSDFWVHLDNPPESLFHIQLPMDEFDDDDF